MKKKVFFACSMRGGSPYVSRKFLRKIPYALEELGFELMSKHQTQKGILRQENRLATAAIHDRDHEWLEECDLVIAEVSNPSDGVGGEIADAVHLGKPVLALYKRDMNEISAYTRGKLEGYGKVAHAQYRNLKHLKRLVYCFDQYIA